jgi:hypothetical protein
MSSPGAVHPQVNTSGGLVSNTNRHSPTPGGGWSNPATISLRDRLHSLPLLNAYKKGSTNEQKRPKKRRRH